MRILLLLATLAAQFEVASVKPNHSGPEGIRTLTTVPGGLRVVNLPLATIFAMAHRVQPDQIINMPSWAFSESFDITAKAPAGVQMSLDTFRPMLVDLLVERFRLKTHRETRELHVYRLVRLHDNALGPKLAPAVVDCTGRTAPPTTPEARARMRNCGAGPRPTGLGVHGMPVQTLASLLAPTVGRVVVDETGLAGNWDLDLEFTSDNAHGADGVSVFAALQEQLGLKLETGRAPVDVIVVDRLDHLTED